MVVLDDFFGEPERQGLLASLTGSSCPDSTSGPPEDRWVRNTADDADAARTWGLRDEVLEALAAEPPPAMLEIQTRLASLFVGGRLGGGPGRLCLLCAMTAATCGRLRVRTKQVQLLLQASCVEELVVSAAAGAAVSGGHRGAHALGADAGGPRWRQPTAAALWRGRGSRQEGTWEQRRSACRHGSATRAGQRPPRC